MLFRYALRLGHGAAVVMLNADQMPLAAQLTGVVSTTGITSRILHQLQGIWVAKG